MGLYSGTLILPQFEKGTAIQKIAIVAFVRTERKDAFSKLSFQIVRTAIADRRGERGETVTKSEISDDHLKSARPRNDAIFSAFAELYGAPKDDEEHTLAQFEFSLHNFVCDEPTRLVLRIETERGLEHFASLTIFDQSTWQNIEAVGARGGAASKIPTKRTQSKRRVQI